MNNDKPKRGGARPGAGRKPSSDQPAEPITLTMGPKTRAIMSRHGKNNISEGIRRAAREIELALVCTKCGYSGEEWIDGGETCPQCKTVQ